MAKGCTGEATGEGESAWAEGRCLGAHLRSSETPFSGCWPPEALTAGGTVLWCKFSLLSPKPAHKITMHQGPFLKTGFFFITITCDC